jgi:hypothetical protein
MNLTFGPAPLDPGFALPWRIPAILSPLPYPDKSRGNAPVVALMLLSTASSTCMP